MRIFHEKSMILKKMCPNIKDSKENMSPGLYAHTKCQYLCFLLGKVESRYEANSFFVAMLHAAVMVKKIRRNAKFFSEFRFSLKKTEMLKFYNNSMHPDAPASPPEHHQVSIFVFLTWKN